MKIAEVDEHLLKELLKHVQYASSEISRLSFEIEKLRIKLSKEENEDN